MVIHVDSFLKKHHMHAQQTDTERLSEIFLAEMRAGLRGDASTLGMYPSYINFDAGIIKNNNRTIAAIDAGGTHLRIGLIKIDKQSDLHFERIEKYSMIGRYHQKSREDFFDEFTDVIYPLIKQADAIGISFAFPGKITAEKDLIIKSMAKEISVSDIEGASLRENIVRALKRKQTSLCSITVVNDAVASLIASTYGRDLSRYGSVSGLIVGTGTNSSYREKCSNIMQAQYTKMFPYDFINVESGCFGRFDGGDFDHTLDKDSELPGDHKFEKMIGGKYLGELTLIGCRAAQEEGLLSAGFDLTSLENISAKEINEILLSHPCHQDDAIVREIAQNYADRAAKLICANMSAVIAVQQGIEKPAFMAIEGSTIEKLTGFKEKIHEGLRSQTGIETLDFVSTENAVLIGAAIAASVSQSFGEI